MKLETSGFEYSLKLLNSNIYLHIFFSSTDSPDFIESALRLHLSGLCYDLFTHYTPKIQNALPNDMGSSWFKCNLAATS